MLYVYGKHRRDEKMCKMGIELLREIDSEENSIIKRWKEQGMQPKCAADSQALLHGVLPMSLELDQTFIGAILTAIGYSINDKVVIFDRIREFTTLYPKHDKLDLFNTSLNTTLARTLNTSFSTLVVLLCIFVLGGDSIRSFSFAMILGVVFGTLSSIFVAAPIAYKIVQFQINKKAKKQAK